MPTKKIEREQKIGPGTINGNYGKAIVSLSSVNDRWDVVCTVIDPETKEEFTETFVGIEQEHVAQLEDLIEKGPKHIPQADVWDRIGETAAPRVLDAGKRIASKNLSDVSEAVDEILPILDRQAQEYLIMKDAEKEASKLADLIKANPEERNNPAIIEKGRRLEGIFNMAQKSFIKDQQNIDGVIGQMGIPYMPPSRAAELLLKLADEIDLRREQLSSSIYPLASRMDKPKQASISPSSDAPESSSQNLQVDPSKSVQQDVHHLDLRQNSRKKELLVQMMGDFSGQIREMSREISKGELKNSSLEDMSKRMRDAAYHFNRAGELQEKGMEHLKSAFSTTVQGVKQAVGSVLKHL